MQTLELIPGRVHEVRVVRKTKQHPWSGRGYPWGYTIDGIEGPKLVLVRGQRYVFNIVGATGHPFYFTDSAIGARAHGEQRYGHEPMDSGTLKWKVRDVPDMFFYQCAIHKQMGGMAVIAPQLTSTAEAAVIVPPLLPLARHRRDADADADDTAPVFEGRSGPARHLRTLQRELDRLMLPALTAAPAEFEEMLRKTGDEGRRFANWRNRLAVYRIYQMAALVGRLPDMHTNAFPVSVVTRCEG
ncbi:hypothetical protein LCGC14_2602720, partial [marine sediment metagenome]